MANEIPNWVKAYLDNPPVADQKPIPENLQRKMNGTAPKVEKNDRLQTK